MQDQLRQIPPALRQRSRMFLSSGHVVGQPEPICSYSASLSTVSPNWRVLNRSLRVGQDSDAESANLRVSDGVQTFSA